MLTRDPTREHEEMIREPVEIGQRQWIERGRDRDRRALGTPDDCPGKMKLGRAARAGRQDEAAQRLQILVHPVDLALEPVDLLGDDAQHHLGRREILAGGGEIGAEIEQFVLDPAEHRRRFSLDMEQGDADRAVRLVDVADRGQARIGLRDSRAVDEAGLAGIAGAGVDLVEPDQRATPYRALASS